MERETLNKVGIAALALLLPGGMIVGGVLALREYRKRKAKADPLIELESDPKA